MSASKDAGIVAALHSDRVVGFNHLYAAYADTIYRYASSLKVDTATARAITTDTMLAAVGNVGRLKQADELSSWLLAIAANEAVKHHAVPGGGVGQPLPVDLHGDVAARLGVMLRSGVLPDIGPVDARGFPEAAETSYDEFGPDTVPTSAVDLEADALDDPDATALLEEQDATALLPEQDDTALLPPPAQPRVYDGPIKPPPPGATPLIPRSDDDEPAALSQDSETKQRRAVTTAIIVAAVVMGVGAVGIALSGVNPLDIGDDNRDVPTSSVTATGSADTPTGEPTTPTSQPTTPTSQPTTPTNEPTTPTSQPTTPTSAPTTPSTAPSTGGSQSSAPSLDTDAPSSGGAESGSGTTLP
ncbi:MAG: sigma-70 family RNA polymerase sigma factor [Actinobacteria bacterium]|nr:sigma-70 family RNA polymerase sigma factor [Actinomycetota bacterium]